MSFEAGLETRHALWSLFAGKRVFNKGEGVLNPTRRGGHGGGEHGFE
jgi:hypothetical protein